jgi:transposase
MAWKSGQSYSADLRSRVLAAIDGGSPAKAVAERFRVSVSYIDKALARRQATGEIEARPQRNHQELKLAAHHEAIAAEVARHPDVTLNELRAWLLTSHGVSASLGLMHRTLVRLGQTLKKRMARPVCKWLVRFELSSLRQRIRPLGVAVAKMEIRALRS